MSCIHFIHVFVLSLQFKLEGWVPEMRGENFVFLRMHGFICCSIRPVFFHLASRVLSVFPSLPLFPFLSFPFQFHCRHWENIIRRALHTLARSSARTLSLTQSRWAQNALSRSSTALLIFYFILGLWLLFSNS